MGPHVDLELLGASESLLTSIADIGLFSSMCSHVNDKLTALYECFVAKITLVRALPSMDPHVAVQLP